MPLLPPPAPRPELEALPCAELRARCRRALFAGARPGFRGPRAELRRAVHRFLRRHRRDRGALLQALRAAALSSSLVLALLGLSGAAGADYVERSGSANPLPSFDVGLRSAPVLVDIDGDGDLDLFSGQDRAYGEDGFYFWENTGTAADPAFLTRTGSHNPLAGFRVKSAFEGGRSTLAFADLDDDGDLDALTGEYEYGALRYLENVGLAASPRFEERTGSANPFDGLVIASGAPSFGDLDDDGDLDLVSGSEYDGLRFVENTGSATSPAFLERTDSQNPLGGFDPGGSKSVPALADLDGDGDLDLVVGKMNDFYGNGGGTFSWFENTGSTASNPAFVERTGSQNPLDGFDTGADSAPTLGDLDADGDLDLVSSREHGRFILFENTGSSTTPIFLERSGTGSPVRGFTVDRDSTPALADLDADGDLDGVSGSDAGGLAFFENTGSALVAAFADRTGSQNPFEGFDAGDDSAPALADLDGDGDLDGVSGNALGTFTYLQNTGSASAPAFLALSLNPLSGVVVSGNSTPALADVDGDGDVDLVAGSGTGTFAYAENVGTTTAPAFVQRTGTANPLDGFDVGYASSPVAVDFDADGDVDVVSGQSYGTTLFENTGTPQAPAFAQRTGPESPFAGITASTEPYFRFALGDLDADGDLDAVAGENHFGYSESNGNFRYFENAPDLERRYFARPGSSNPLAGLDVGAHSNPAFVDIDGDGDFDVFSGADDGSFAFFENTGSASDPAFVPRSGTANPLGAFSVSSRSQPRFADLDGDGDLDAVSGEGLFGSPYGLRFYENTGSATSPAFAERSGSANPFFVDFPATPFDPLGSALDPSFSDLDGDGDLDLVTRHFGRIFRYHENTGGPTQPAFVWRPGGFLNPLGGIDFANSLGNPAPVLVDLDGDGDSDLVSGSGVWGFRTWENTGTATDPAFVPAASPLQGLGQASLTPGGYQPDQITNPTFADIDADGDLDVFFAHSDGTIAFFENAPPVSLPLPWWVPLGAGLAIGGLALRRRGLPPRRALPTAAALLLLAGAPGRADYVERSGAANPLPSFDVGSLSTPALVDIDADGDLDLFSGQSRGYGGDGFRFWENTGSAADPAFLTRTGSRNPLAGFRVRGGFDYGRSTPAFADLDGDGDLDATSGEYYYALHYFENVGSAASPAFVERTGSANPFDATGSHPSGAPAFVDLDGDADLDVVIGAYSSFVYLENTGTATSPAFAHRTGSQNPLAGLTTAESYATPAFGDLDGDGDLDLAAGMARFLGGGAGGTFAWFENTGSATGPAFVQRTGSQNPLDTFDVGNWSAPALADLDADGLLDLVSGEAGGGFALFENTGATTTPSLVEQGGTGSPFQGFSVDADSAPALADLDADGDLDAISGSYAGGLAFFQNTGAAGTPAFADRTGSQNPFDGFDAGGYSTPALADLDGDGDLDLVSGRSLGTFAYLLNTGSAAAPAFLELLAHPLSPFIVGYHSTPALGDLDGDGDIDLVSGRGVGSFAYLENTGTATAAAFIERTGSANPLDGLDTGSFSAPTLVDADGDGDLDVFSAPGGRAYFENTGTPTAPAFLERTGPESPFAGIMTASKPTLGAAALGDLDADGDLDAIAGESYGRYRYFENAPDRARRYFARTGSANPLSGFDVGAFSSPVFADIDADGDLDAFSGAQSGSFSHFENTGSASAPAFQQRSGTANALGAFSVPGFSVPCFVDLDGDGDLDVVAGEGIGPYGDGGLHYYENTGTASDPAFAERTGSANPLAAVTYVLQPSFADLDGDGDLDLAAREIHAPFRYYENTGSASSPAFARRFGGAFHPLAGVDLGEDPGNAPPVLIDLDGDGDSDLVTGDASSGFRFYENTGTATRPAFVPAPSPLQGLGQGTDIFRPTFADIDADGDLDVFFARDDGSFGFFENAPVSLPLPGWARLVAALALAGAGLWRRATRASR